MHIQGRRDIFKSTWGFRWLRDKEPASKAGGRVWSLGREDPLAKGMVTYSSILAWRIPWTEEHGRLQYMGFQKVRHNLETKQQQQTYIPLLGNLFKRSIFTIIIRIFLYFKNSPFLKLLKHQGSDNPWQ